MATYFYTDLYIEGPESDLQSLYQMIQGVEDSCPEVVYGQWWLGLFAKKIGYPDKIDARCGLDCYYLEKGILYIRICAPFNEEQYFVKYFVKRFPYLKFTVIVELEDYSYASTNDVKGKYVPYRYRILIGDDWIERKTYKDIKIVAEKIIHRKIDDHEDIQDALDEWAEAKGYDETVLYVEYELIEF